MALGGASRIVSHRGLKSCIRVPGIASVTGCRRSEVLALRGSDIQDGRAMFVCELPHPPPQAQATIGTGSPRSLSQRGEKVICLG